MIKKLMRIYWKDEFNTDAEFEALYYLDKIYFSVQWFVFNRILFYLTSLVIIWLISLICICQTSEITIFDWILSILLALVLVILVSKIPKKKLDNFIIKKYQSNSEKLINFFFNLFTVYTNKVISIKIWKKIKSECKELYLDLTSESCEGFCYYYSLVLGLIHKDVDLIWGSCYDSKSRQHYAHAFIVKNEYVYDSNQRLSYKFDDYAKANNLKIYRRWKYSEYNTKNFRSSVREDFRKWCEENKVKSYSNF